MPDKPDLAIELFGAATGLLYIYFSIRQRIWLWPLGFVTSAIYTYVFFVQGIYASMGLQVYYLVISVYGWIHWKGYGENKTGRNLLPVTRVRIWEGIVLSLISILLLLLIAQILTRYTDSTIPYWDAAITAGSIVATWMLARKYLENWLVWIFINSLSVGLYIYKDMYPTVVLFIVYTLLAFRGYSAWRKDPGCPDNK